MVRRAALAFLGLSSPLMLVAFVVGGEVMEILFAILAAAFPVALIAIAPHGRLGPLMWVLGGLLLVVELAVVGMLVLRGEGVDGPWFLGLPLATAIQVYGLFLLPLPLVSFAYALTFDRFGLTASDVESLRRRFVNPEKVDEAS